MSAERNITLISGDSYSQQVIFDDDQDAYTFTAELSDGTDFTVTQDGSTVTLSLSAAQTTALTTDGTVIYKWKFRRTAGSVVLTLLHGKVTVIAL